MVRCTSTKSALGATAVALLFSLRFAQAASLLPLVSEQSETLPSGKAELVVGMAYSDDERFPYFTEAGTLRSHTLIRGPQLGFRIGAGDWAEIQASFETIYVDETTARGQHNEQFGAGDARLHTKVRLLHEGEVVPGLGVRFGAKLPNANVSDRLGTDETDFNIDGLISKDFGIVALYSNLGVAILGNPGSMLGPPHDSSGQDDLFTYTVAATSDLLGEPRDGAMQLRVLGEVLGEAGTRFDNDRHSARVGIQLGRGAGKIYLGTSFGLVTGAENIGAQAGFIYTFSPAELLE